MGKINYARVLICGLLSGLIINISEFILNEPILGEDWRAAMEALNRPAFESGDVTWFVILGFVLGILCIWVYAAIRPRFNPGPKTAICAGITVWALAYAYPSIGFGVIGLFPAKLIYWGIIWGLFELCIATLIGAWLYKET
jgi:hypothetical protein